VVFVLVRHVPQKNLLVPIVELRVELNSLCVAAQHPPTSYIKALPQGKWVKIALVSVPVFGLAPQLKNILEYNIDTLLKDNIVCSMLLLKPKESDDGPLKLKRDEL
jgi:hypothetical protein